MDPTSPPTPALAGPIPVSERIRSLDILRGVAVLGIFVMNSRNFALPLQQFDNPAFPGPAGSEARTSDLWVWAVSNIVFEDKMIAIFSMLFGAGIVIAAARSVRPALIHYRRMFWLFVIGLIHAFLLWYGDILNTYAICGAMLYPFRRMKPALLVGLGVACLTVAVWVRVGPRMLEAVVPNESTVVAPGTATPPDSNTEQPESLQDRTWRESIEGEQAAYRGSWWDLVKWRAKLNIVWHWYGCIDFNFWRCGGFMLIGMGIVQLGVLSASRPATLYWGLVIGGYGLGAALVAVGFWPQLARALGRSPQMSGEARQILGSGAWVLRYTAATFIALGHVGVVMLLCRAGERGGLRAALQPLAAVGRTALSNYLLQTVIAVVVFDGSVCQVAHIR